MCETCLCHDGIIKEVHYNDVIMSVIASQITSLTIVYSTVYSGADQRKHQSCASLAFVWGIHRGPVNSPYKWPVKRKMFPFDDVIMKQKYGVRFLRSLRWSSNWVYLHQTWPYKSENIDSLLLMICLLSNAFDLIIMYDFDTWLLWHKTMESTYLSSTADADAA